MGKKLRKCIECNSYTIEKLICPYCGGKTKNPYPPKFSTQDRYGKYRRQMKVDSHNQ